jgi:hypothetical protein
VFSGFGSGEEATLGQECRIADVVLVVLRRLAIGATATDGRKAGEANRVV